MVATGVGVCVSVVVVGGGGGGKETESGLFESQEFWFSPFHEFSYIHIKWTGIQT